MLESCTCGEAHPHEVMRRSTSDGIDICLWSDGMITGAMGYRIRGVPAGRPRTTESQRLALRAGRLLLGEVCLYDRAELGAVYAAARKAAAKDGLPGTLRAEIRKAEKRPAQIPIAWTVLATDRDGKARERFGRLPRLRWPGRAVFDFCGGSTPCRCATGEG